MSDLQVKSLIERILKLHAEEAEIASDRREVYAEAKSAGFDKSALGEAVRIIRRREKDAAAFDERTAIVDLYLTAFDGPSRTHVHVPAREAVTYPERVSRPAPDLETSKDTQARQISVPAGNGADQLVADDDLPEPDATPAGAVVAITSGATAGETAAAGLEASPPPADSPAAPFNLSLAKPLRPHCQNPDRCGSYGSRHCFACREAAGLTEAA